MQSWAIYTLVYSGAYAAISLAIYLALPWLARLLVARLLSGMGETVCADFKKRSREMFTKGREYAMSGPQSSVVGHLVEPYLERLTSWGLEKVAQHPGEDLNRRYTDACVDGLRRYRLTITLAAAQVVMTLLAIGYLLRGVF